MNNDYWNILSNLWQPIPNFVTKGFSPFVQKIAPFITQYANPFLQQVPKFSSEAIPQNDVQTDIPDNISLADDDSTLPTSPGMAPIQDNTPPNQVPISSTVNPVASSADAEYAPNPLVKSESVFEMVHSPIQDMRPIRPQPAPTPEAAAQVSDINKREALVKRWIAEKEQRYRAKNPNYKVDPRAEKMMYSAADKILGDNPDQVDVYDPKYTDNYAFQVMNSGSIQDRIAERAPKKPKPVQSAGSRSLKNPVASATAPNPPEYAASFEDMQRYSENWIREHGWNADTTSPIQKAYREAMKSYGSRLYPGTNPYVAWSEDAANRGVSTFGNTAGFAKSVIDNQMDNMYSNQYTPRVRNSSQVQNNLKNPMQMNAQGAVPYPTSNPDLEMIPDTPRSQ